MRIQQLLTAGLLLGLAARFIACGGGDDGGITGNGAGTGHGASNGKGGNGNAGSINIGGGGNGVGGGLDEDSACVGETKQAESIPLSIYIMLDKSGSMVNFGAPKWQQATDAINAFVADTTLGAVEVALQVWSGSGPCDGSVYNTPAVPMGPIPQIAPQIQSFLGGVSPGGNTPMEGAIRGLTQFTTQYQSQNPGKKVVGLLVTDGLPTSCDQDPGFLNGLISSAFNGNPSVLTYAMGMDGADFNQLDQFAQAGGTGPKAFNANSTQTFLDALKVISGTALLCEFTIPSPEPGKTVNPGQVNVSYTAGGGGGKQQILNVPDAGQCGQNGGWYYDNPSQPTRIIFCPSTCDVVKSDATGKIDLILGCSTIAAPPS